MSDNKDNNSNSNNNNNSFFSKFPPSPFHLNAPPAYSYYPYAINNNFIPCNKCIELQNEMRNMETQMKLMNKNIELLNEQIKLLDLKMSIMPNRQNNRHPQQSFNRNRNRDNVNKTRSKSDLEPPELPEHGEPKLIIRLDDKIKKNNNTSDKKNLGQPPFGGLFSSLMSLLDSLEDKKETSINKDVEDSIIDDVSEYNSEDEFTELDVEIKTLNDLISLGEKYVEVKEPEYTDKPNDDEIETERKPDPKKLIVKGIMTKDGKIKFFNNNNDDKPAIKSNVPTKEAKEAKETKEAKEAKELNEYMLDGKRYSINLKTLNNLVKPLTKLNKMIGLTNIKNAIIDMIMYYLQNFESRNNNLLHTVIEGPPGVGKTEVGKIMAEIYSGLGVIPSNRFTLVKRTDLIGQYVGSTAIKTQQVIDEADGGVLFIDEAYSLGNEEKKDVYSKECIDVLNQNLTEKKRKLIIIIAGYSSELEKCFFSVNPGLRSRFPFRFKIEEYNANEIKDIFIKKVGDIKWKLNDDIDKKVLIEFFNKNKTNFPHFGRDIDHLLTNCKFVHSRRVFGKHPKNKRKLTIDDITNGFERYIDHKKKNDDMPESVKQMYGRF